MTAKVKKQYKKDFLEFRKKYAKARIADSNEEYAKMWEELLHEIVREGQN